MPRERGVGAKWASLLLLLVVVQIAGLEAAGDGDMADEVQRGLRQQKMTSRYAHLGRVERSSSASEKNGVVGVISPTPTYAREMVTNRQDDTNR